MAKLVWGKQLNVLLALYLAQQTLAEGLEGLQKTETDPLGMLHLFSWMRMKSGLHLLGSSFFFFSLNIIEVQDW